MSAYYNEHDPFAAEWLRQLIKKGLIADGVVDTRSIVDVRPEDLRGFVQCHFFAGIGVWSYAARLAGWPDDRHLWTGSCPCQPFSGAGKGDGFADERHLWPHFHWLIENCRPSIVVGEQVSDAGGLAWIDLVSADLEGSNYTSAALDLCAASVGAPHKRQRLYWMAYDNDDEPREGGIARSEILEGVRAQSGGRNDTLRLDDLLGEGLEGFAGHGDGTIGRQIEARSTAQASILGSVADIEIIGRQERRRSDPSRSSVTEFGSRYDNLISGLADDRGGRREVADIDSRSIGSSHGERETDFTGMRSASDRPGPTNGFWGDSDWLFCRDGKWRAVEPGTLPLANGVANRVGKLRGYGNAIVAPLAAQFLEIVKETVDDLH